MIDNHFTFCYTRKWETPVFEPSNERPLSIEDGLALCRFPQNHSEVTTLRRFDLTWFIHPKSSDIHGSKGVRRPQIDTENDMDWLDLRVDSGFYLGTIKPLSPKRL
jgi:hypothetical protein